MTLRVLTATALAMVATLFVPQARAQPRPVEGGALSLKQALTIAQQNPPDVLAAIARMRAAEAQIEIAQASLMPTVGGNLGASLAATQTKILYGEDTIPAGLVFPGIIPTAALDGSVVVRWPVSDFGRTRLVVDATKHGFRNASADVRSTANNAMVQVAAAYFTVLSDEELVAQTRETVHKRAREATIARELVQNGARAPFEQARAEVALEAARTELVVAEGKARRDAVSLASALGLEPSKRLQLITPSTPNVDADEARATDAAIASRPQMAASRARLTQAKLKLAAARASYRPLLTVNGTFGGRYANRVRSDAVIAQGAASVVLSVPFFDPTVAANVRLLEAQEAAANAEFLQASLIVRTEAVQAATALYTARATLAQAGLVASAAASTIIQAEGRYQSGSSPLVELLDAQAADVMARIGVVRARLNVALATVQLLASTGHLDDLMRDL